MTAAGPAAVLAPVYGPLCRRWEHDMPMEMQDGCGHDSCWFQGSWGRLTGAPRPLADVSGRVRFFFANEYSVCTSCGKDIWFDDTVCIDQAGTGLRHEDCADEH